MDSAANKFLTRKLVAFVLPMAAFLVLLALGGALRKIGGAFWLDFPEYWIYPAQTIVCGALLIWFWREYEFRAPRRIVFAAAVALLVFAFWIAPQAFLGFPPRLVGFDPEVFSGQPAAYWATIVFRFLRLVVVVPLVEEIFLARVSSPLFRERKIPRRPIRDLFVALVRGCDPRVRICPCAGRLDRGLPRGSALQLRGVPRRKAWRRACWLTP